MSQTRNVVIAVAIIAGAILAVAFTMWVASELYPQRNDNWDLFTGYFALAALPIAAAIGAFAGWYVAVHAGEVTWTRTAAVLVSVLLLLVVMGFAVVNWPKVAVLVHRDPGPPGQAQREAWARNRREITIVWSGLNLAHAIERCIRGRSIVRAPGAVADGCHLGKHWYALGEDSMAALGAYDGLDEGWRWDLQKEDPLPYIIFPDPRLDLEGPVYEVGSHVVLRRERRGAPAFATDSSLTVLAGMRRCMMQWADSARTKGWNGDFHVLPRLLDDIDRGAPDCPVVQLEDTMSKGRIWEMKAWWRDKPRTSARVTYMADRFTERGFQVSMWTYGRQYWIDSQGKWLMGVGRIESEAPRCLYEVSEPCDQ